MDADTGKLRYASFLTLLIIVALFLAARLVYLYLADPKRFPISTVKIAASYHHITHKDLESVLTKYLNSSFFSLPVGKLYADLSAFDWSNKIQVERIWPDTLKIILVEKVPVATWNNAMITEKGELFNQGGRLDTSLPHLSGPVNQQKEVLQVYKKMSKILSVYGLHAASLEWRDNRAWELTLANGVQLRLGKRDLETKIIRFCKAYPAVFAEKSEQLVSVDLRYPRGMAVQWKK
ncbi:cell division protein FtsQ/DivIB [Legionella jamestowniensis]|uniref:Cell division protein FtsQ n=1 Tax=Legionella jamestowniensis TaxID=455 RepID=A0A0W0UHQ7_9GAMM|nr:cell division protein FtsQ/DivIB [Legionella jamestowniensis]KTD07384.1 cell division protein FtsQ [Legionella jamestowniensis]SFL93760.1 cell division protein FtsQ [Legionella jamestowniensis DSM 19215]